MVIFGYCKDLSQQEIKTYPNPEYLGHPKKSHDLQPNPSLLVQKYADPNAQLSGNLLQNSSSRGQTNRS